MIGGLLQSFGGSKSGSAEYVPMTRDGRSPNHPSTFRYLLPKIVPVLLIFSLGVLLGTTYPSYLSIYTRRPPTLNSYLPVSLPPQPSSFTPPVPSLPAPLDPVPNIVHYVYGLDTKPQPDFPYFAYLAMRSAMMVLKPKRVLFHCIREPQGYWWDRVMDWEGWTDDSGERRGSLEVLRARDVESIGKDRRPVHHYAHKADIIRLEVLLQYGGVYLDIDTFIIRSFAAASLYMYDSVLGMEARGLTFLRGAKSDDEMNPKGLCNAIIVSRPGATFLRRWLESYDKFDETQWTEHSVEMPWTLAKLYPTTVTVLSDRVFFWPIWTSDHIHAVYSSTEYDFEGSGQLAYHAWESKARKYLSALDPTTITAIDTSFTRMARAYREPGEQARWRAARELDGSGSGAGVTPAFEEGEEEEIGQFKRTIRYSREHNR